MQLGKPDRAPKGEAAALLLDGPPRWPARIKSPKMVIFIVRVTKKGYYSSIATDKGGAVKQSEFRRWLESQGVEIRQGTNHLKLYYQGRQSTMPRHPSKELGEGLRKAILKQLGIK